MLPSRIPARGFRRISSAKSWNPSIRPRHAAWAWAWRFPVPFWTRTRGACACKVLSAREAPSHFACRRPSARRIERMLSKDASILVVDDEEDTCRNLSDILTDLGYHVDTAHDGPAALEMVRHKRYDVALLDLKMPGMDGL